MYLVALAYLSYWRMGHLLEWFPDIQSFAELFWTDPTSFHLIARGLHTVFATLAIPATYFHCRRVAGEGAGLVAATSVAVSPLHDHLSKLVRDDRLTRG